MAGNYGIRTSKVGTDATVASGADLIMSSRYPFAKIDQTKLNTFRTTTVTFLNDVSDNTKTLVASFEHGYTDRPQVIGIWSITWGPGIGGGIPGGYGYVQNTTGVPVSHFLYEWDTTNVYLYFFRGSFFPGDTNAIGTVATLTTYVFVDDLSSQDYTV